MGRFGRLIGGFALSLLLDGLCTGLAGAQGTPARPADPAFVAASGAFERFDPVERRAIQRDLVWVAGFTGAATGEFGPLTFAALKKLDSELKLGDSGLLTGEKRKLLAQAAQSRRQAVGFRIETDAASKMRIGVPIATLGKRSTNPAGLSRWQDEKGQITLDLMLGKPDDQLAALFERGIATNVPGRKVTYKLLRPDFFVISGETEGGKFYRPLEKGSDGVLRGFSIGYSKATASGFEPMVIAIATSFEAEPGSAPATTTTSIASLARPAPSGPRRINALEVAPGRLVTAAAAIAGCKDLKTGPANLSARVDKQADGLALLLMARPAGTPLALAPPAGEAILLQRDLSGEPAIAAATLVEGRAEIPLQMGGAGAALLDRAGRLVGLVSEAPRATTQVAGIVPAARYRFVAAPDIAAFAGLALDSAAIATPRSMSAIAAQAGPAVVSLICGE